jgi:hypothetical protein
MIWWLGQSTMSAQTRYRTLVHNISRVYSSQEAGRTELLQAGIDEIVTVMSPSTALQWRTVKSDTERLLRVWSAKEGDSDVASVVAAQITGLLDELSTTTHMGDRISHIMPVSYPSLVVEEPARMVVPISVVKEEDEEVASVPAEDEEEEQEEDEESDVASVPESVKEEEEAPAPTVVKKEEVVEEEEEVVEPEEEEAEEEEEEGGLEVEQVMIRGRTYWKDGENKLYAVIRDDDGEEDVGDEVGVLENGKPRFLAK